VPYDVVNTEEARAQAAGNPLSFLHVSRAEIDLPPETDPYSPAVYAKAVENFARLKAQAPLVSEETPSVYLYRLRMRTHVQTGVAACYSLAEYEADGIKKHERTRRDKEDDRTRHILELRAQTGPVLLTYRAAPAIDAAVGEATKASALLDCTGNDAIQHTIWRLTPQLQETLIAAFAAIPALYIADGHHRAASAARVRQQLRRQNGCGGEWDTVLGVAFPHNQMQVLPYNRVVKDLSGHNPESLLTTLRQRLRVSDGSPAPSRKGEVSMFLDGRWYTVDLGPPPAGIQGAERLDVTRLHELVLAPALGIGDARTDKRIDFVGGIRGTAALEALVGSRQAAIAFSMYPVSVEDLMAISDIGAIMPPKSTWFEPKLRDGLLSHLIGGPQAPGSGLTPVV
jgi:uncharacterized protein (DUF1015 family)